MEGCVQPPNSSVPYFWSICVNIDMAKSSGGGARGFGALPLLREKGAEEGRKRKKRGTKKVKEKNNKRLKKITKINI